MLLTTASLSQEMEPEQFKLSTISEKIGNKIDLNIPVVTETGQSVTLNDLFNGQPVIFNFVYYSCPLLCNIVVSSLSSSIEKWGKYPGDGYKVISLSFDPRDKSDIAKKFKDKNIKNLPDQAGENWHFLTTDPDTVKTLFEQTGYNVFFDEDTQEYSHAAALILISPEGNITRYLYGLEFDPIDLKLSTIEAKQNKMRSAAEKILLFCYNYDPDKNSYTLFAQNLMKIGAFFTVILLGVFILRLKKAEKI